MRPYASAREINEETIEETPIAQETPRDEETPSIKETLNIETTHITKTNTSYRINTTTTYKWSRANTPALTAR